MVFEIPINLLRLRATVKRYELSTGEYTNTVYTNLPCRLILHKDSVFQQQVQIPAELETPMFVCNYYFNSVKVDLRKEDRIVIGANNYRLLAVHDSESAEHHYECSVEHLKTMGTAP